MNIRKQKKPDPVFVKCQTTVEAVVVARGQLYNVVEESATNLGHFAGRNGLEAISDFEQPNSCLNSFTFFLFQFCFHSCFDSIVCVNPLYRSESEETESGSCGVER